MKFILILYILVFSHFTFATESNDSVNEQATDLRKAEIALKMGQHSLDMATQIKDDINAKKALLTKAEAEFSLAISYTPENANLYFDRARTRYLLAMYDKAIDDFNIYLSHVPNDGEVIFLRGLSKSVSSPEDTIGACSDFIEAKTNGYKLDSFNGIDKYCAGQEGWQ